MPVKIDLSNKDLRKALDAFAEHAKDLAPAWRNFGEYKIRKIRLQFVRQVDPYGRPWEKLASSTRKAKKDSNKILKILQAEGDFRKSIIYQVRGKTFELGSTEDSPKAEVHNFGAEISVPAHERILNFKVNKRTGQSKFAKKSKANFQQTVKVKAYEVEIPARPWLAITREDEDELYQSLDDHFSGFN